MFARLWYLQVMASHTYVTASINNQVRRIFEPAPRGRILDRNGLILASSIPAPSLWAIPKDFDADKAQRKQLAKLLGMTSKELEDKLDDNQNFVWLRRQAEDQVAKDVLALGLKGVHQVREYKRRYPQGEAATHVVGFTNVEDKGQEGIELGYQDQLGLQSQHDARPRSELAREPDLNRARKMLLGEIPDPFSTVANDYLLFRTAPAAVPGFQINSFAKLFGCFYSAGIGGRIGIADGITF